MPFLVAYIAAAAQFFTQRVYGDVVGKNYVRFGVYFKIFKTDAAL